MQSDNSSQTHINSSVDQGIRSRTLEFRQMFIQVLTEYRTSRTSKRNYPISAASFIHFFTLWFEWFDNRIWVDTTSMVSWAELHKSVSFLTFHPTICKLFKSNTPFFIRFYYLDFKIRPKMWQIWKCRIESAFAETCSLYMGSLYVLGWKETHRKEFSYQQVLNQFIRVTH